jgi:hypothetical protein
MVLGHTVERCCSTSTFPARAWSPESKPSEVRHCRSCSAACRHTGQGQVCKPSAQARWQLWPHCQVNNCPSAVHRQMGQTAMVPRSLEQKWQRSRVKKAFGLHAMYVLTYIKFRSTWRARAHLCKSERFPFDLANGGPLRTIS